MTSVPPSATPPAVSLEGSNESFATSPRERVGSVVLIFLVAALTVVMFTTSNNVVDNLKVISDSGSTTYNMAITQRESLVFTVAFDQWLSGTITRRELQIRRALLAQRLVVRDNTGVTNGSRVRAEYFEALGELDGYTWEALPGYLPPDSQASLRSKSADALEQFNFESRELSVRISQSSDRQTRQLIAEENSSRTGRYVSVLVILGLMAIVFGFLDVARRRNHRLVRARARNERRELEELRTELKQVDDELQSRLERERIMRAENNWLDSTIRSITLQFKSTFESEQIAEFLAEGLGRELNADSVICYSFDEVLWPGFVKQWHRGSDISFDESLLVKHESTLSDMVHDLWSRRDVIIVEDSQLIDLSQRPIPEVAAITKELARSWVIAPVADGSRVLGFVFIMMTSDVRAWSSTEIALIQTVSFDAASVCIHARMFRQSMQIAENDAEVNRLVELDRVKNDFIENMNHELRTPLTSIIGYLEVIMDDVDVESEPELV
ncbi:MAG: histidine kinase dimerization/phospho-acceptor domain-containing protein, partial [Actinomycetota bacterium]